MTAFPKSKMTKWPWPNDHLQAAFYFYFRDTVILWWPSETWNLHGRKLTGENLRWCLERCSSAMVPFVAIRDHADDEDTFKRCVTSKAPPWFRAPLGYTPIRDAWLLSTLSIFEHSSVQKWTVVFCPTADFQAVTFLARLLLYNEWRHSISPNPSPVGEGNAYDKQITKHNINNE